MDKVYRFDTSKGAGVPGLPHEISESQAKELGVFDLLQSAIQNGMYVEVQAATQQKRKPAEKEKEITDG